MKFVFLCNPERLTSDQRTFVSNFPKDHELILIHGEELLETKKLPQCDALITERSTWQKYFSMWRYFDLLDQLESVPIGMIVRSRRSENLKGRAGIREMSINPMSSTEDILNALDRLLAGARELTGFSPINR